MSCPDIAPVAWLEKGGGMGEEIFPLFTGRDADWRGRGGNGVSWSSTWSAWALGQKQSNSACIHHQVHQGQLWVGRASCSISHGTVGSLSAYLLSPLACPTRGERRPWWCGIHKSAVCLVISSVVCHLGTWHDANSHSSWEHLQQPLLHHAPHDAEATLELLVVICNESWKVQRLPQTGKEESLYLPLKKGGWETKNHEVICLALISGIIQEQNFKHLEDKEEINKQPLWTCQEQIMSVV